MEITRVLSAPFAVNSYVIREGRDAMIVDSSSGLDWPEFGPRLLAALGDAAARTLYLTHLHVDHVGAAARIVRATGAQARMHEDEATVIIEGDARLTGGALFGVPQEPCAVVTVREGDIIELGRRRFEVLLVPGHSPGHSALWEPESRSLFCGDVVFAGGAFGRVDLPGADARELIQSLEKLAALDARDFYAGHMDPVIGNAKAAILESLDNARLMLL